MKYLLFLSLLTIFYGCNEKYISTVHNDSILQHEISCMKLILSHDNLPIESTLKQLYSFDSKCELSLVVSFKDSIVCNSNQNSEKKALGMPRSYLRLELKKEKQLFYSYYIDLSQTITNEDVIQGFNRMKNTLPLEN